jgi:hypothetical protein
MKQDINVRIVEIQTSQLRMLKIIPIKMIVFWIFLKSSRISTVFAKYNNAAQPAVGTDLAFGQGSRRIASSMALVVY